MRRVLLLIAAAVVLLVNAWALLQARHNRSDPAGGTLELTDRTVRLVEMPAESTAMLLELRWRVRSARPRQERSPEWLDAAKLSELGFDCGVPVSSPQARDHYRAMPTRPVFLVLEPGAAAEQAPDQPAPDRAYLYVVDAGCDARRLREKYPDPQRQVIARGLVRLSWEQQTAREDGPALTPQLRGWIQTLLPEQIFVPQPHSRILEEFRHLKSRESGEKKSEPRFAVTISWGTDYTPWVRAVRRLETD